MVARHAKEGCELRGSTIHQHQHHAARAPKCTMKVPWNLPESATHPPPPRARSRSAGACWVFVCTPISVSVFVFARQVWLLRRRQLALRLASNPQLFHPEIARPRLQRARRCGPEGKLQGHVRDLRAARLHLQLLRERRRVRGCAVTRRQDRGAAPGRERQRHDSGPSSPAATSRLGLCRANS